MPKEKTEQEGESKVAEEEEMKRSMGSDNDKKHVISSTAALYDQKRQTQVPKTPDV